MADEHSDLREGAVPRRLSRHYLIYYGTEQRQLEYDFVVAPGADPKHIELKFEGSEKIEVDTEGNLLVSLSNLPNAQCTLPTACPRPLRFKKPDIYQMVDGKRH